MTKVAIEVTYDHMDRPLVLDYFVKKKTKCDLTFQENRQDVMSLPFPYPLLLVVVCLKKPNQSNIIDIMS